VEEWIPAFAGNAIVSEISEAAGETQKKFTMGRRDGEVQLTRNLVASLSRCETAFFGGALMRDIVLDVPIAP
jgi:hypothetical protein